MSDQATQSPDPVRSQQQRQLKNAQDSGFGFKLQTSYELRNQWGEKLFETSDRKDAEQRLIEIAADGIDLDTSGPQVQAAPVQTPGLTLHEVQSVEISKPK